MTSEDEACTKLLHLCVPRSFIVWLCRGKWIQGWCGIYKTLIEFLLWGIEFCGVSFTVLAAALLVDLMSSGDKGGFLIFIKLHSRAFADPAGLRLAWCKTLAWSHSLHMPETTCYLFPLQSCQLYLLTHKLMCDFPLCTNQYAYCYQANCEC